MPRPSTSTFYITYRVQKKIDERGGDPANFEASDLPSKEEQSGAFSQALGGAGAGASVGATVGSAVPVVGNAVGAAVGSVVGGVGSALFGGGGPRIEVTKVLRANLGGSRDEPAQQVVESEEAVGQLAQSIRQANVTLADRSGDTYDTGEARQYNNFIEITPRPVGDVIAQVRVEPPDPVAQAGQEVEEALGFDLSAVAQNPAFQVAGTVATVLGIVAVARS